MNTKLCIATKINIQKRYGSGAGGGDKVGKIVKETGKLVAPMINEAVTVASKVEGQNTPQEKETTEKSKTKSTQQTQSSTSEESKNEPKMYEKSTAVVPYTPPISKLPLASQPQVGKERVPPYNFGVKFPFDKHMVTRLQDYQQKQQNMIEPKIKEANKEQEKLQMKEANYKLQLKNAINATPLHEVEATNNEKGNNQILNILLETPQRPDFIVDCIEMLNKGDLRIPDEYLSKVLKTLEHNDNFSKNNKEYIIGLIRVNHQMSSMSEENKLLIIKIWQKETFEYKSLTFKPIIKNIETQSEKKGKDEKAPKKEYHEKQQQILDNIEIILKPIMEEIRKEPESILQHIDKLQAYLDKRDGSLEIQQIEFEIYKILNQIIEQSIPKFTDFIPVEDSVIKNLAEQSSLPANLKKESTDQCFIVEDYEEMLKQIKEKIDYLVMTKTSDLSESDLKLLSLDSGAAIIDDENTYKFQTEFYKTANKHKESLGFKFSTDLPQKERILKAIKNKEYFVVLETPTMSDGTVTVSHLAHKSIIIYDVIQRLIRVGILTSTKDETTFKLDDYQITNPDPAKQGKCQMLRICGNMFIVDPSEIVIIDLETTLYFFGKNRDGFEFSEILHKYFTNTQEIWSQNPYQYTYKGDYELIRKASIFAFIEKFNKLNTRYKMLKEDFALLQDKSSLASDRKIEELIQQKEEFIATKKYQQYFSSLSKPFQKILSLKKQFKAKLDKNIAKNQKKAQKLQQEEEIKKYQERKKSEKEQQSYEQRFQFNKKDNEN